MQRARGNQGFFLALAVAGLTGLVGAALVVVGHDFGVAGPPVPPAAPVASAASAPVAYAGGVAPLPYSIPVRLTIERLGIDTDLMTLGMNPDQSVQVPPDDPDGPAGWYRNNPSPGEPGTAVILGHVDAHGGRAVFYPLGLTRAGDKVLVRRADGRTAQFTVDRVASYPREAFPTDEVYGSADRAALRLVTCGGDYDRAAGGYQQNVVVFASLAAAW